MDEPAPDIDKDGDDEQTRIARANAVRREFGLPPLEFDDDTHAPPVNRDLIEALVKKELDRESASDIMALVERFQSWNRTYAEACLAADKKK